MSVIVGADGAVKINLGDGIKYIANITSWTVKMSRGTLRRTTLADEAERRTGGLADWSGDFRLNIQLSDDTSIAQSAWQLIDHAISGSDDDLKAELRLILQAYQLPADHDIFHSTIPGIVGLSGTVVITDLSLNCEDPERPLVAVLAWEADGALGLWRS